ncbi:hypothetical protein [Teichococcus vastitatis]|uniref:DUF4136 domain-containing protein n=1 Tax=Teichococcus vastitatis TaxID=2307076 RepID=A0ABS9W0P1_9PROT|nr:hypothetical protein [Pseudoroseomonas vastitatis]MCI0752741.1 hypothetical protein [Pseudoroseomonas vastitatis]
MSDLRPTRLNRRRLAFALPFALLAGCATDPARLYLGGWGVSVRGAALNAPFQFGDLSRWNGQPDRAALAVVQLEYLADEFSNSGYWSYRVSPLVTMQLQQARGEVRRTLGIAGDAPPEAVMNLLRQAAYSLQNGQRGSAEAALASPFFSFGPAGTLRALSSLPWLRRAAEASGAANAEIRRLDNERNS